MTFQGTMLIFIISFNDWQLKYSQRIQIPIGKL